MEIVIEKDVEVAARDGAVLSTDVYRPAGAIDLPTLIQRTPYDKGNPALLNYAVDVQRAVGSGYAVVVQDTRGRFGSSGTFTPFLDESADGADTVDWVADQSWSSGRTGMIGGSYFGLTQHLAASAAPAGLRAIAPHVSAADPYNEWTHRGGAFELGFCLSWTLAVLVPGTVAAMVRSGEATRDELLERIAESDRADAHLSRLPLSAVEDLRELAPYYFEWLDHPDHDAYWRSVAPVAPAPETGIPALNSGGWFDLFLPGTIAAYQRLRSRGTGDRAPTARLVVGPWAHGNFSGFFPEQPFGGLGSLDVFDLTGEALRWFDHHLRGIDNGLADELPVRLFVTGANVWRSEEDWPLPGTSFTPFYLHSGGGANGPAGDGRLDREEPAEEPADAYVYDPTDPVPTVGGATFLPGLAVSANSGPRDQRRLDDRRDILCYSSGPLSAPLEVIGPVELVVFVVSSAADTDFTGKLVDVYPGGRSEIVTDGILRARYRDSYSEPRSLERGRVYELRIDLGPVAREFGAGHRIRVDVSSSNFPRFDRNGNTGGLVAEEAAADFVPARNEVHHGRSAPSRLVLPVIDR